MRRFATITLFVALSAYVTCTIVTKDVPMTRLPVPGPPSGAPHPPPMSPVDEVAKPNSVAENVSCAKVGEFCISHKDCCSNGCHGYLHRCVSARELDAEEE
ncbi:hypothetical protein PYW07_016463 [Mythimna separata]|uniref:Uncharacterized protein n=1 Tax=Mythimna separata TaxID=271217 RepID=A0AAD8DRU7_MYTSE|nr:hypothetical protein PYW07_016463 [Mythimna separata]